MKRASLTVLITAVLTACGGEPPASTQTAARPGAGPTAPPATVTATAAAESAPQSTDAAARLGVLQDYLAAWNEHDAARAGRFLTDDSEYFDAAFAGRQSGRDAIVEKAIGVFLRGLPDLRWEMRSDPIVGRGGIAYEWTLTGTNTGSWGGIPVTNQRISLKGMSFVRFQGDKISYQAVVYDSASLNRQLGL